MKEVQGQGKYVGPLPKLQGQTALIRHEPGFDIVLAQFDNLDLGPSYSHAWRRFSRSDWELKEPTDWGDD